MILRRPFRVWLCFCLVPSRRRPATQRSLKCILGWFQKSEGVRQYLSYPTCYIGRMICIRRTCVPGQNGAAQSKTVSSFLHQVGSECELNIRHQRDLFRPSPFHCYPPVFSRVFTNLHDFSPFFMPRKCLNNLTVNSLEIKQTHNHSPRKFLPNRFTRKPEDPPNRPVRSLRSLRTLR